ncbi:MAG: N-acetyl-gamma-glutamyl-phosphate reductase [Pedosphaera sp.]|nr:N-acetyl-gamma-glutamyl-phosphate reductase [Pedosphaera sp.]MSU43043.1 N-acetyl-gamma-glutamyl-phosphate reductase [Pedosphaera sp.]
MSKTADTVKIAIVGASGYSGEELVRLLLAHPRVNLVALTSRQHAGKALAEVLPRFAGHPAASTLRFSDASVETLAREAQVVFLALPHGVAAEYARPLLSKGCKVIDLSADFRLKSAAVYQEFYGHAHPAPELLQESVYGLPEIHGTAIRNARLIASPGCYPTSILLPTLPLLRAGLIKSTGIIASSLSGVSGAGRKAELPYLFVECNESARPYSVPKHRHLSEIEQELATAAGSPVLIQFTPHLIPVNRGILTTLHLAPARHFTTENEMAELGAQIEQCYRAAYSHAPFVRLLPPGVLPDTKHVTHTNFLDLAWRLDARTGRLIVMSAIDNIVKGAGGQAVQSLNILCGFEETAGLI